MKTAVFILIDAVEFYVSVERSFQLSLRGKPIVVVGSQDSCLVALSKEARELGLKRGQPLFQCEPIIRKHQVQVFSANFSLYHEVSVRMMGLLGQLIPRLEVASIDEAFGELTGLNIPDHAAFARHLKAHIWKNLSISVHVAIAPTKSLTKVGAIILKATYPDEDVIELTTWPASKLDQALEQIPVEALWGIGENYARFLHNYGVHHARAFRDADERWVKRSLTVVGARLQQELRGVVCFPLRPDTPPKQQIVYARSFPREISQIAELEEILSFYVSRAAEKLRAQESLAGALTVFLRTNSFQRENWFENDMTVRLSHPTAFTPELLRHALASLHAIFREEYRFKKAGIILHHLTRFPALQLDLFHEVTLPHHYREMQLMALVDALNRIYGQNTLFFAAQGSRQTGLMRQEHLSRRYLTRWREVLTI